MPEHVTFHGNRAQLAQKLRELPALLAGKVSDPSAVVQELLGVLGLQALSLIKEAYITKARGGTDEAGITWQALSPRTIAYGRRHPGLTRKRQSASKKGRARRPLLTNKQDELWRRTFTQALRRFERQGQPDAKAHAAAIAWAVVKRAGGKTILDEYGKRPVEILRDTGRLFNSLSPGMSAAPVNGDQVFRYEPGAVVVGTNVEYAEHVAKKRPLWPSPEQIPQSWWDRMGNTLSEGVNDLLKRLLSK